jgi:transposase-like protein
VAVSTLDIPVEGLCVHLKGFGFVRVFRTVAPHSEAVGDRIRLAVKAVLEQILEEEMTEHVGARPRERVAARTGERNGSYSRDLITPVGKIEQLRVPRDRDGTFATRVFEEYHRSTGQVEDAVLEMWLQGISHARSPRSRRNLGAVRIARTRVIRIAQPPGE